MAHSVYLFTIVLHTATLCLPFSIKFYCMRFRDAILLLNNVSLFSGRILAFD